MQEAMLFLVMPVVPLSTVFWSLMLAMSNNIPTLTLNALRVEDLLLLLLFFLQFPCVVVAKNEWLVWV